MSFYIVINSDYSLVLIEHILTLSLKSAISPNDLPYPNLNNYYFHKSVSLYPITDPINII